MYVIAIGGPGPSPHFGPPKLPIIKGTPAETMLQGLVQSAEKKENWFTDSRQSAERRRIEELNAEKEGKEFSWPEGGWHDAMKREITVPVSDGEETYQIIFTIDEGTDLLGSTVLVRHATIAVKGNERYLDQTEAFTLLHFLGFKEKTPIVTTHPDHAALVFMEKVDAEDEQRLRSQ